MDQFQEKAKINRYVAATLIAVHIAAIASLPLFTWPAFWTFFILYVLSAFGITFGFHRLFTHRSFKTSKPIQYIAALLGTLAMQGNIVTWVGHHRMHHAHSDTPKDPHDAHRGFWYSHMLWMFRSRPEFDDPKIVRRYARDIVNDPFLRILGHDATALALQIVVGLALYHFFGLAVALWGIFVRLAFVYHVTWFVNSACHMWGYKNYEPATPDLATNCWWVGILALGEGWHNNHHSHEQLAYHGHKWWEFDFTGIVIRVLASLGLAWDVKGLEKIRKQSPVKERAPTRSRAPVAVSELL